MKPESHAEARRLADKITPGKPQPALTAEIARCPCPPEAKAGLFLLNGDWRRAHETSQELSSPPAAYWHALVHRHEGDYGNSKYWLRRCGTSPVHARLLDAAEGLDRRALVAPDGLWDGHRFTDLYADPAHDGWTRELERLEMAELLELSLRL